MEAHESVAGAPIILHGGWSGSQLYVWGETTARKRTRAPSRAKSVPTYPFAVKRGDLLNALPEGMFAPYSDSRLSRLSRLYLWLPAADGAALPSTLTDLPPAARLTLDVWGISALPLPPAALLNLLEAPAVDPGFYTYGADLCAWQVVYAFAVDLIARQRFAPCACRDDTGVRGQWEPLLTGDDARYIADLARALPGACRAIAPNTITPPGEAPETVLRAALTVILDALLRRSGALRLEETDARSAMFRSILSLSYSLHDRWMTALTSSTGVIQGFHGELEALLAQTRDWRARHPPPRLPFLPLVRLVEPANADEGANRDTDASWQLHYFLQSVSDPSLLLSAADLADRANLPALPPDITPAALRQFWEASLARIAEVVPASVPVAQGKQAMTPLDTRGAFDFLTDHAAALERQGIIVQVPAWWVRAQRKERVALRARMRGMPSVNRLRAQDLIAFDWRVAIGDTEMTRAELMALAQLKAPLVQAHGKWMQVDERDLQAALDFWKKQGERPVSVSAAARLALDSDPAMHGLAVDQIAFDGWLDEIFARLRQGARFDQAEPIPAGLCGDLRPYQARGYAWLRYLTGNGLGACLADDMGLGKTIQTLALIQRDWEEDPAAGPVLIVCPTSVIGNWRHEARRFTPDLPALVHHGGERMKDEDFAAEAARHAIVITSYSLLHRDLAALKAVPWRGIVLDEAQNIKNPETKQAHAAKALPARYRVALTGTPVENSVGDLWSIMDFLNPGLLGTQTDFRRAFLTPIQLQHDSAASERLKRLAGPFILRRVKSDPAIISDLPDKLVMPVYCTLTKEQASLYEAVVRDMTERLAHAEGLQRRGIILATLTRLKQVCNHPAHFLGDHSRLPERSGKLERLEAMLEEALAEGDRALIFTQFAEMGELLRQRLLAAFGEAPLFLHGQTPQPEREEIVRRFQAHDGPSLLILSLKAGGLGLNLTRANHVFHFDRWWNPAVENQATDRAYRIGQTRNVQVHTFICSGTLEERIDALITEKQALASAIVGSGEGWLTELSTDKLREVVALRPDAVAD